LIAARIDRAIRSRPTMAGASPQSSPRIRRSTTLANTLTHC